MNASTYSVGKKTWNYSFTTAYPKVRTNTCKVSLLFTTATLKLSTIENREEQVEATAVMKAWKEEVEKQETLLEQLLFLVNTVEDSIDSMPEAYEYVTRARDFKHTTDMNILDLSADTLKGILVRHGSYLYYTLAQEDQLKNFTPLLWLLFNSETNWNVVLHTITDMPTQMFEDYMFDYWAKTPSNQITRPLADLIPAIHQRTDKYKEFPDDLLEVLFAPAT